MKQKSKYNVPTWKPITFNPIQFKSQNNNYIRNTTQVSPQWVNFGRRDILKYETSERLTTPMQHSPVRRRIVREVTGLKVGIAYKEYGKWKVVPINSTLAREKEPEVVKMIYDTFNRYPSLKHEIEKREKEWRKKKSVPAFSGSSYDERETSIGERIPYLVVYPAHASSNPLALAGSKGGRVVVFDISQKEIDKVNDDNHKKGIDKQIKKEDLVAFSILHELKHEDQALRTDNFESQQTDYDKYYNVFKEKFKGVDSQEIYHSKEAGKLYYEDNPYEKEALDYALQNIKRLRKGER